MDIREIKNMSLDSERKHWWIQTRYNYIDMALQLIKSDQIEVTEFGCGTCQNLWFLREKSDLKSKIKKIVGIDPELPTDFKPDWARDLDRVSNNLNDANPKSDLILAMDVLEHIADDKTALLEWVKNLKSTGKILITVPAFKALWSYHDEFLGHERRYTKKELLSVAKICGLRPVFINYSFSYLFPIVFLVRAFSSENNHKTDLILPHPIINKFLTIIGKLEAKLGGFALFGTSVIGIFELDHENSKS